MTTGWFDAFRENGAPTWYGENRSPVFLDFQILSILSIFTLFILTFLIICCGIRRYRWISTISWLASMAVGLIIFAAIHSPYWHTGRVHIFASYRAFSAEKLNASLGVRIGLTNINITLTSKENEVFSLIGHDDENGHGIDLNYNERFEFSDVSSMEKELEHALYKGLPYPILKVIEYLSVDRAGFVWGRQYRLAGYYTYAILWLAFACWLLQMLLLVLGPHYFAKTGFLVGVITLVADLVYVVNTPSNLHIRYPALGGKYTVLTFHPSVCVWVTLAAGIGSLILYGILWLLQARTTYRFRTIFSIRMDEFSNFTQPIPLPQDCAIEAVSVETSLASSSSSSHDGSETPSTISCTLEHELERP